CSPTRTYSPVAVLAPHIWPAWVGPIWRHAHGVVRLRVDRTAPTYRPLGSAVSRLTVSPPLAHLLLQWLRMVPGGGSLVLRGWLLAILLGSGCGLSSDLPAIASSAAESGVPGAAGMPATAGVTMTAICRTYKSGPDIRLISDVPTATPNWHLCTLE